MTIEKPHKEHKYHDRDDIDLQGLRGSHTRNGEAANAKIADDIIKYRASMRKNESNDLLEKLTAADPASKWIDDFEKSDDPRFTGKSEKERKEMALGAYYAKVKESVELLEYKLEQTPKGVKVVHNGKIVHSADSVTSAQKWIDTTAKKISNESIKEQGKAMTESIMDGILNQDYLSAEAQFKTMMAEKAAAYMATRKQEVAETIVVNESMKLLGTHQSEDGRHTAKVYKDSEWQEHRVKYYTDGKHLTDSDSHHDDKEDAEGTAKAGLAHMQKNLK